MICSYDGDRVPSESENVSHEAHAQNWPLVTYSIVCCLKQVRKMAQIQEIEIQTPLHCKGRGFREKWGIGILFIISLLEPEWNVKIKVGCHSVSLLFINKEVDGRAAWSQPQNKDRITRIAETKCHSPHDGVDIWIKPTLLLDFTDT